MHNLFKHKSHFLSILSLLNICFFFVAFVPGTSTLSWNNKRLAHTKLTAIEVNDGPFHQPRQYSFIFSTPCHHDSCASVCLFWILHSKICISFFLFAQLSCHRADRVLNRCLVTMLIWLFNYPRLDIF